MQSKCNNATLESKYDKKYIIIWCINDESWYCVVKDRERRAQTHVLTLAPLTHDHSTANTKIPPINPFQVQTNSPNQSGNIQNCQPFLLRLSHSLIYCSIIVLWCSEVIMPATRGHILEHQLITLLHISHKNNLETDSTICTPL